MGKFYSTKEYIAKRRLRTLCNVCRESIQKGEKYTKHQSIAGLEGYFVEHVVCPRDRKKRSKGKIHNQFYSMKKE